MKPDPVLAPCPKHRRYWARMTWWSDHVGGQEEWAIYCPDDIIIGIETRIDEWIGARVDRAKPRVVERKWARP